ncbi:hypothetical protein ACFX14_004798 [Malus domestica]
MAIASPSPPTFSASFCRPRTESSSTMTRIPSIFFHCRWLGLVGQRRPPVRTLPQLLAAASLERITGVRHATCGFRGVTGRGPKA